MLIIREIPQSDATNVYDLLQDVKRAILEEPKRLNMGFYASFGRFGPKEPACGTVGCFAGWVSILSQAERLGREKTRGSRFPALETRISFDADTLAKRILGKDLYYMLPAALPYVGEVIFDVFNQGEGDGIDCLTPGTRAYARAVVRRINRFIAANGGRTVLSKRPLGDI